MSECVYKPDNPALNVVLMSASSTGICKFTCTRLKDVNLLQLWTAWSALLNHGKGKASLTTIEFNFQ